MIRGRVEVELTLPPDVAGDSVEVTLIVGEASATHKILIDRVALIAEKEPNDGFKQAQPVKIGDTMPSTTRTTREERCTPIGSRRKQE